MMKKMLLLALLHVMISSSVCGQDKDAMGRHQRVLKTLFTRVEGAATDNERYLASEEAMQQLLAALDEESSQRWRWELGDYVSVLTSGDGKLRVFSWAVVRDDGEFECFGVMQYYDEREEEYRHTVLTDKSDEIVNREETVLDASHWLGAVYQSLIETRAGDRTYYTLLGWNGVDKLTQRKIIEPICFKSGGSTPQFGQNIFRKEPNLRRIVLEYKHDAMVNLSYEEQYLHLTERVRPRRSSGFSLSSFFSNLFSSPSRSRRRGRGRGRASRPVATAARTSAAVKSNNKNRPTYKTTDKKQLMIIFDQVAPQVPGMEGLYQYYVPSGVEMAYLFNDGKWELYDTAQGRDPNKKLNKEFEPMEKPAPAYQVEQTH
jgi:hypothetical protein